MAFVSRTIKPSQNSMPIRRMGVGDIITACNQACDDSSKSESGVMNINITKNIGMLLLAIYLILVGILGVGVISFGSLQPVVAILAIIAGVFILLGK
jgi:hypothetical protein